MQWSRIPTHTELLIGPINYSCKNQIDNSFILIDNSFPQRLTLLLVPGMCSPVNSKCTLMTKIFEALSQNLSCNNALVNGMVNCVFDSRHEHYDIFQVYHWSIEGVPTLS